MRFVDEYRDRTLARDVASEIARLADPRRHYRFMEVCGGHTHTIYKHGIEGLPAAQHHSGARPRLPGLRHPHGPRG